MYLDNSLIFFYIKFLNIMPLYKQRNFVYAKFDTCP